MIGNSLQNQTAFLHANDETSPSQWWVSHLEIALNTVEEAIVKANAAGIICWYNTTFLHLIQPELSASEYAEFATLLCGKNLIDQFPLLSHTTEANSIGYNEGSYHPINLKTCLSPQEHPAFLGLSQSLRGHEYEFYCQGKVFILEITATPLEEPNSDPSVLLVIRNVTEYKLIHKIFHPDHFSFETSTPLGSGDAIIQSETEPVHYNLYETITTYLANYAVVGRLARLFTHMMLQMKLHKQDSEKSKDQLQAVINAVPGMISWIKSDATYLGVNYHLAHMFKMKPEDFVGQKLGFIKEDTRMNEFLRSFISGTQSYDHTTVELELDHDLRHYIIAVQKYDQGKAIVAVGIDITEQKRVEEALIIAEENYRSIFENSLEGIFQTTPQGKYIRVNPALAKIYGYESPEDMINSISNIGEQVYVDIQERKDFIQLLDQKNIAKDFEYRCYTKDRRIIWVQVDARVVRDNSGHILYYEGTVQDITKRKRKEAELKQQIENLKIEIDQQKRAEEVLNLTTTTYFQQIKQEIDQVNLDEFWA